MEPFIVQNSHKLMSSNYDKVTKANGNIYRWISSNRVRKLKRNEQKRARISRLTPICSSYGVCRLVTLWWFCC